MTKQTVSDELREIATTARPGWVSHDVAQSDRAWRSMYRFVGDDEFVSGLSNAAVAWLLLLAAAALERSRA